MTLKWAARLHLIAAVGCNATIIGESPDGDARVKRQLPMLHLEALESRRNTPAM